VSIVPFAWKDKPSLIERLLPAQKISAEAQKERKAGAGQTLTALGSYWKGRKPLILVKACILGSLLPATNDPEADLAVFEKLMAIDDEAFLRREFRAGCFQLVQRLYPKSMTADEAIRLFEVHARQIVDGKTLTVVIPFNVADLEKIQPRWLQWREEIAETERAKWHLKWIKSHTYLERVAGAKRPEELDQDQLFALIWPSVNQHLGTTAQSMPELINQLGILRFGKRPVVGDTFCGGGSIPFEAARLGCDVYASDLNPIACMLTWGALNIIGAPEEQRRKIEAAQQLVAQEVDREITKLGIEHDSSGNRAKAYLYCLETKCPQTGWLIPLAPSWVISKTRNVIARLVPDHPNKRFNIEILSAVSQKEMDAAVSGTVADAKMVYELDGQTYSNDLKDIRGDFRQPDGSTANRLRRWEKEDFVPRPSDIFQERLYCIQWITAETIHQARQKTFFAGITDHDAKNEEKVLELVSANLAEWQEEGLVPDMQIVPGDKTDEPIRTRGWTYWHHLFNARQLLGLALFRAVITRQPEASQPPLLLSFCIALDNCARLCSWNSGHPGSGEYTAHVFYNQALNTLYSYSARSVVHICKTILAEEKRHSESRTGQVACGDAIKHSSTLELAITDPPYADAINYHEITEYFVSWLKRAPPAAFSTWTWDTRRSLAIAGSGETFRRGMISAYGALAAHMPGNGIQIVMFTHQDAGVWADMAAIVWGAGLQVAASWYIATETTSDIKKGGYVQGTALLVLRKRVGALSVYRDELAQEVRSEVARQIETMTGLNQSAKGAGRSENLFEDQDLQMGGYAAALRVLTSYSTIDGRDMAAEAIRPKREGEADLVKEIIDFAVQVANEYLVPHGVDSKLWGNLTGPERFYLRMLDIESSGAKKLENYQNFAKAFRFGNYSSVMGSNKPNDARLKTASEFKRAEFESEFGKSALRAVLFTLYELQQEVDIDDVMAHLHDLVNSYWSRREDVLALANIIALKRAERVPSEAEAARILANRIRNERL